jgi:hypothetical protein
MKANWKLLKALSVFLVLFAIFYGGYLWLRGDMSFDRPPARGDS